jgi:2-polyprenyl-3-methyl-5-hydroxy-6-metoxy-1,4-benzoquinol methylase
MPITNDIVIEVYKNFLNREPESPDILKAHAERANSATELIQTIVASDEFRRSAQVAQITKEYGQPLPAIDVDVSDIVMHQLMERVRREWKTLGENDPYWSVLTNEAYRHSKITDQVRNEFLATGNDAAEFIERFETRAQTRLSRGTCFELGCGVGRVTYYLSKKFEKVIAADISPGNIELCKRNLESLGVTNVEYLLVTELADYQSIEPYDFLYSIIVLQHNTPPVQKFIIDSLAKKIKPGGGCFFQTPAWLPSYSFSVAQHLTTEEKGFEMHAIPMSTVLRVLHSQGIRILDISPDHWTGLAGSYTYFGDKPLLNGT